MPHDRLQPYDLHAWRAAAVADLARVAARDRWGFALMVTGWAHLAAFAACQALYSAGRRDDLPFLSLWAAELAVVVAAFRFVAGRGWHRASPLAGIILRLWMTFLILSLSIAVTCTLVDPAATWFKLTWTTLSSFGLAATAWLVSADLLWGAVWMALAGVVMARNPGREYLVYGVSWWAALQVIGLVLLTRLRFRSGSVIEEVNHVEGSRGIASQTPGNLRGD